MSTGSARTVAPSRHCPRCGRPGHRGRSAGGLLVVRICERKSHCSGPAYQLADGVAVRDEITPQALLTEIDGRARAGKGIDDDIERFGIEVEEMIDPGNFRIAKMTEARAALLLAPDIIERRLILLVQMAGLDQAAAVEVIAAETITALLRVVVEFMERLWQEEWAIVRRIPINTSAGVYRILERFDELLDRVRGITDALRNRVQRGTPQPQVKGRLAQFALEILNPSCSLQGS